MDCLRRTLKWRLDFTEGAATYEDLDAGIGADVGALMIFASELQLLLLP